MHDYGGEAPYSDPVVYESRYKGSLTFHRADTLEYLNYAHVCLLML